MDNNTTYDRLFAAFDHLYLRDVEGHDHVQPVIDAVADALDLLAQHQPCNDYPVARQHSARN